jgi:hypothetical protein
VRAPADIAVFSERKGEFGFGDCGSGKVTGDRKLECMLTHQGGKLVYNGNRLTKAPWQDAPAPYWVCP